MSDDKKPEPCPDCKGGESYRDCPACEGTGLASEPAPEVSDGLEWLTEEEVRACLNDADYTGTAGAHHLINYSLDRKYGDLKAQLAECVSKADVARAIWDTDCLLERADRIDALAKLGITPDLLTKGQNNE